MTTTTRRRRPLGRGLVPLAAAALCGLSLLAGGCVEDDQSFYIRQNQVPSTGCQINTNTTIYRSVGTLDVTMGFGYTLYPLVENRLNSTRSVDGQPERNRIDVLGFDVELDMSDIPGVHPGHLTDFFEPASGAIDPAGRMAGEIKVIPDALAATLNIPPNRRPYIMATVKVVGERRGKVMRSGPFTYPIQVCNGCLVDLQAQCPDPTATTGTTNIITNTCGLPQDEPVTCCKSPKPGCFKTSGT